MSLSTRLDKLEAAMRGGHDRLMDLGLWIAYLIGPKVALSRSRDEGNAFLNSKLMRLID